MNENLHCPECGATSEELLHIEGDKWECLNCNNTFTKEEAEESG